MYLPKKAKFILINSLVFLISLVSLLMVLLSVALKYINPYEKVQIRNALLVRKEDNSCFDWLPGNEPKGFFLEDSKDIPQLFIDTVARIEKESGTAKENNFKKAIAIAAHLAGAPRKNEYIDSSTIDTYNRILEGDGVCSDYARVFTGLCNAAGIPVRRWAITFEAYNGQGDTLNEIYDQGLKKWILIDAWHSMYEQDNNNIPLSFVELRDMILENRQDDFTFVQIKKAQVANSSVVIFPNIAYEDLKNIFRDYKNKFNRAYLVLGNNVFGEDKFWLNRLLVPHSRELAQLGSIILGRFPRLAVMEDRMDQQSWGEIMSIKIRIFFSLALLVIIFLSALSLIISAINFPKGRSHL